MENRRAEYNVACRKVLPNDVRPLICSGRTSFWDALLGFGYLLFVFVCEGRPEFLLMLLTE